MKESFFKAKNRDMEDKLSMDLFKKDNGIKENL
jgi:hypothetical protein